MPEVEDLTAEELEQVYAKYEKKKNRRWSGEYWERDPTTGSPFCPKIESSTAAILPVSVSDCPSSSSTAVAIVADECVVGHSGDVNDDDGSDSAHLIVQGSVIGIHAALSKEDTPAFEQQQQQQEYLVQQMEMENRQLLMDYDGVMEDVRETERAAQQITELIGMFESKVLEEAEMIDLLYSQSQHSQQNLTAANEQLVKAEERATRGMFRFFLVYVFLFSSFWILFMHLIHA